MALGGRDSDPPRQGHGQVRPPGPAGPPDRGGRQPRAASCSRVATRPERSPLTASGHPSRAFPPAGGAGALELRRPWCLSRPPASLPRSTTDVEHLFDIGGPVSVGPGSATLPVPSRAQSPATVSGAALSGCLLDEPNAHLATSRRASPSRANAPSPTHHEPTRT